MTPPTAGLIRSIGRWTVAALILNNVIGSGIFGIPSAVTGRVGAGAPIAWVGAAIAIGVIVACFAEVSSRFGASGGPYLYARVAFGAFVGAQMGWMAYLVRVTSAATNVNLFVIYLTGLWPAAGDPWVGAGVIALFIGGLTALNYVGVRQGAAMNSALMAAKLVPLVLFAVVGIGAVVVRGPATPVYVVNPGPSQWLDAGILLFYAYGGFESGLMPLGEAKNPQRDAPFALGMSLAVSFAVYVAVQMVVLWSLPDAPSHERPLADAARTLVGPAGATFISIGALLSIYGWGTAALLSVPRLTYAMAEQGDLPRWFGWVHPRFRTPAASIIAYAVLWFVLAVSGSFLKNLSLAVVSRVLTYGLVCLALIVLRRRERTDPTIAPAAFRLPAGPSFAVAGCAISLVLLSRMTVRDAAIMAVVVALASLAWWVARRGRTAPVAIPAGR